MRVPDRSLGADALAAFVSEAPGPVNVLRLPRAPADAELGVARISYGHLLHHEAMEQLRLLGFSRSARADE